MALHLFAGIPVRDYAQALDWYQRVLGAEPSFLPNDVEAVWELGEARFVFIEVRPEHAGHSMHTLFVDSGRPLERRAQGDLPRPGRQRDRLRRRAAVSAATPG